MQPTSKWDEIDFILFEAFGVYEDEVIEGIPAWMRYNPDGSVLFTIDTRIDGAQAAVDKYDKEHEKDKTKKFGLARYPVLVDAQGKSRDVGGLEREAYMRGAPIAGGAFADEDDPLAGLIERDKKAGSYDLREYGDAV